MHIYYCEACSQSAPCLVMSSAGSCSLSFCPYSDMSTEPKFQKVIFGREEKVISAQAFDQLTGLYLEVKGA